MLLEFGCRYVLVGHSERRTLYGESDEDVADRFEAALAAGLDHDLAREIAGADVLGEREVEQ